MRKSGINRNGSNFRYYPHVHYTGTVGLSRIADLIQQNCTAKRSDVLAVLTELIDVMGEQLRDGKQVRIDGIGTFRPSLKADGVSLPEQFNARRNLRGFGITFIPQRDRQGSNGICTPTALQGATAEPWEKKRK